MPAKFGLTGAAAVFLIAALNEGVSRGFGAFANPGFLLGYVVATGAVGYGLAWMVWRGGMHKRFPPQ